MYQIQAFTPEQGEDSWSPYLGTGVPPSDPTLYPTIEEAQAAVLQDIEVSGDDWPPDQCRILDTSTGEFYGCFS